tara:strand:+ start:230 stop:400 length:171 start_codon:yes stop_codon:yes gene_type:complete
MVLIQWRQQLAVNGAELAFTTNHVSAVSGLIAWAVVEYIRNGKVTALEWKQEPLQG